MTRIAGEIGATGAHVSVAEVTRGLCLLALEIARGAAGPAAAGAFRAAAAAPSCMRDALAAFVMLADANAPTVPMAGYGSFGPERRARDGLVNQAIRLPELARDHLGALARELSSARTHVTATKALRGLCLLAVELVDGAAGMEVAEAFRIAASDSTLDGAHRAACALRVVLEGGPLTVPDPPTHRGEPAASTPPPTMPCAA